MYQEVFDFNGRPFTMAPFVKHFFNDGPVKQALDQVNASLDRDAGPAVIVGQHGTGKSLLLALLAEQHQPHFKVISLTCGPMSERRDLLQAILFELEQPYRDLSEGELRLSLIDFIKPTDNCPNGVLLLVDDAQSLTPDLVDELRLISNFVRDGVPRVRLVLCGTGRLEDVLTEPKLEPFNQRISARCFLANLTREQTQGYVHEHIARVGGDGAKMFETATTDAIHEATSGCPRFVNQLCEQCMIYAATHGSLVVEPNMVEPAWAQVQGLPTSDTNCPDLDQASNDENWTVIEFGSLDDEVESTVNAQDSQPVAQIDLPPEPQIDQADSADFAEHERNPEIQHAAPEADLVTESVEAAIHDPSGVSDPWDAFEGTDPYVAVQPEVDATQTHEAQTHETQADERPAIESGYTYQPIEPDVASAEPMGVESQSIPTEIQALNQDQAETWAAAGITPDRSFDQPEPHAVVPSENDSHVAEEPQPTATSPNDWSPDAPFLALESAWADDAPVAADPPSASDQQAESVSEEPVAPVVNPFAEAFETEESVASEFSQLVAQQNASSMQVTGEQLDYLPPVDQEPQGLGEVPNQVTPVVAASADLGQVNEASAEWESPTPLKLPASVSDFSDQVDSFETPTNHSEPAESAVDYSTAPELSSEHSPQHSPETETAIDNAVNELQAAFDACDRDDQAAAEVPSHEADTLPGPSPIELEAFHEHQTYQPTADIQAQADKILSAVERPQQDAASDVPHETATGPAAVASDGGVSSDQDNVELSDAQRILGEILEQKNLVSDHVRGTDADDRAALNEPEFPPSVPMSQSVPSDAADGHDDDDQIVISEMPSSSAPDRSNAEAKPESGPVSIGRATRMDYEALFEQLRDVGKQS